MTLEHTIYLVLAASISIPLGALISSNITVRSYCLRNEIDSFVLYFGGGALLAAISLSLLPRSFEYVSIRGAAFSFFLGGLVFWKLNSWLKSAGGKMSNLMGMMLDFVPESIILGATAAGNRSLAYLLAILIVLQNLPEGFAAFTEMNNSKMKKSKIWLIIFISPLLGPIAAFAGYLWLSNLTETIGVLILFCSGGIIYLVFDDIAPQAQLENKDFPAIGAVAGFLMGLIGTMMIH